MKDENLQIPMTDEMKSRLRKISEETGLGMSSIARRGLHEQMKALEK